MANRRNDRPEVLASSLLGLSFGAYSGEEILRLSVKEINNPQSFDTLNHPNANGLYDSALGPTDKHDYCGTCSLNNMYCPGHMGHVILPMPVFNPVLFTIMFQLLKNSCFHCHRIRNQGGRLHLFSQQMRLLDLGFLSAVYEIETIYNSIAKDNEARELEAMSQIDDFIANLLEDDENEKARPVRNVTECRQELLKEFLTGKYPKLCPHCGEKAHSLNQQQQIRVYFKKARTVNKKEAFKFRQAQTENNDDDNKHLTELDAMVEKLGESVGESYLTPNCAKIHMQQMWSADQNVLHLVLGAASLNTITPHPTDVFFLEIMPVPPSRFRPVSVMHDQRFENSQTTNLLRVIEDTHSIRHILAQIQRLSKGETTPDPKEKDQQSLTEQLYYLWTQLQMHVNSVVDSELAVTPIGTEAINGIRQILEKKSGLFRMHMMGKRVNFAARSVISPDPYINTNEVGIPDVFAKKLTYPEPVTHWNFHQLKQAVINGPDVHPGANIVETGTGRKILLTAGNRAQREAIANQLLTPDGVNNPTEPNKKVYRHLKNGDVMLLNRQPTLHRPSIQAHKARILPGEKTIRLHYANCKAYNADFDGDEMNAHFPQNEICRAESYHIASTSNQYLVPKDGTPLAGLIQDHMVSGVMLTIRGRFFCRSDYQQLVYAAMTDHPRRITWLPPSILKPHPLWSGKQVVSTLILNAIPPDKPALNLIGRAKIPCKEWLTGRQRPWMYGGTPLEGIEMSESEVVISNGELLVGVLDKGHYGATPYGLIHSCYELYGGDVSSKLLTYLGKLFTTFLQKIGFTLGVQDILVSKKADKRRRKFIKESYRCGNQVAAGVFSVEDQNDIATLRQRMQRAHFDANTGETKDLDLAMKGKTDEFQNSIARVCIPHGLHMKFPQNNLQLMVLSGAKGSSVNCMQISCLLGQIELEGKRPPLMLSGQSLPSFLAYDTSPRAGGFVAGRFLTGIRPQEYFFHCMAGREGLVDTAVKTSRSGYLQRCIVKHLEGLVVNYDLTVRDSDGSVIQFLYGDEGLDITKTQFLNTKQFPFLIRNHQNLATNERVDHLENMLDSTSSARQWKKLKKWRKQQKRMLGKGRKSGFLNFCRKNPLAAAGDAPYSRSGAALELCNMWKELDSKDKDKYCKKTRSTVVPVISHLRPDRHFGAISEALHDIIEKYLSENPDQLLYGNPEQQTKPDQISAAWFKRLLHLRTLESLAPPGEAVGLLAAQSIGEPSTQMTLNTFHFAGRGEMNVTLGIPRLREILMTASGNIKTPTMDIPLLPTDGARSKADLLKKKLTKTSLHELLQNVDVVESLSITCKSEKYRVYDIRFQFLPYENYQNEYFLTPIKILQFMELNFFLQLQNSINKRMNELRISSLLSSSAVQKKSYFKQQETGANRMEVPDEDLYDDDFGDDGDASATRSRDRQLQERDYEGEEEEMNEMGIDDRVSDKEEEGIDEDSEQEKEQIDGETASQATPRKISQRQQKRISNVLVNVAAATKYQYDINDNQWCRITLRFPLTDQKIDVSLLIENEAKKTVVCQTPQINRCFLSESRLPGEEGLMRLKTDGVNIQEMYKYHDILDLNKLYTNDVQAIAETYGIEAAGRAIIKEMRDVFAAYGIDVNYRHLSIIADYMTFQGRQLPFSRLGIASNPSPFQKMTYETSMQFLKAATVQGARDDLKSPSSRLVVGQLVNGGTGSFTLVEPFS